MKRARAATSNRGRWQALGVELHRAATPRLSDSCAASSHSIRVICRDAGDDDDDSDDDDGDDRDGGPLMTPIRTAMRSMPPTQSMMLLMATVLLPLVLLLVVGVLLFVAVTVMAVAVIVVVVIEHGDRLNCDYRDGCKLPGG